MLKRVISLDEAAEAKHAGGDYAEVHAGYRKMISQAARAVRKATYALRCLNNFCFKLMGGSKFAKKAYNLIVKHGDDDAVIQELCA